MASLLRPLAKAPPLAWGKKDAPLVKPHENASARFMISSRVRPSRSTGLRRYSGLCGEMYSRASEVLRRAIHVLRGS